jgi:cobalt-zinc-cadmium efflux system outer membrane protein
MNVPRRAQIESFLRPRCRAGRLRRAWRVAGGMLAGALVAAAAGGQPAGSVVPLTLVELERLALEHNPTLRQAAAAVAAARGRADQAGLWPNPRLGYLGDEISPGPIMRGGEHGVFVEQTVPLGGKLRLSRAVFLRETGEAEALVAVQRQRVLNAVRLAYYDVLAATRRVEVRTRLVELTAEAAAVSRQLANVGAADRPDVLEAEIEARRAALDLTSAENARMRAWATLAAVVGDPTLAPRPLDGSLDAPLPRLERDETLARLLASSPELAAARAAVQRAEATLARARREPVPDLVLRGGPRYNRELLDPLGTRPVGWEAFAEAGVSVPLFDRNQGAIAAAAADLARAREELTRLELALRAEFAAVFDLYLTARQRAETYRADILPRAEEAYRLYLDRFRALAAAYPQVLIAQRNLFQLTDEYVDAARAAWQAAVRLEGFLLAEGLEPPSLPRSADVPRSTGRRSDR